MRAIINTQVDYPVISIVGLAEEVKGLQQLSVEHPGRPADAGAGASVGAGGAGLSQNIEVDLDESLAHRYVAARAEWIEVQRLLMEEHGETILESEGGRARNPRRMMRMVEWEARPEWIPEEQARGWGIRGGRPR